MSKGYVLVAAVVLFASVPKADAQLRPVEEFLKLCEDDSCKACISGEYPLVADAMARLGEYFTARNQKSPTAELCQRLRRVTDAEEKAAKFEDENKGRCKGIGMKMQYEEHVKLVRHSDPEMCKLVGIPCALEMTEMTNETKRLSAAAEDATKRKARGEFCQNWLKYTDAKSNILKYMEQNQSRCEMPESLLSTTKTALAKELQLLQNVCSNTQRR
jgi:hypothetical protein